MRTIFCSIVQLIKGGTSQGELPLFCSLLHKKVDYACMMRDSCTCIGANGSSSSRVQGMPCTAHDAALTTMAKLMNLQKTCMNVPFAAFTDSGGEH